MSFKVIIFVSLPLLLVGFGCLVFGYSEYQIGIKAHSQPKRISCDELVRSGPGDNIHIELTDFHLLLDAFVRSKKEKTAYIPVVATHDDSTLFSVILLARRTTNQDELKKLANAPTLRGMVINDVAALDASTTNLLKQAYPQVDVEASWIIDHQRTPTSPTTALLIAVVGGVLLLGCTAFLSYMKIMHGDAIQAES